MTSKERFMNLLHGHSIDTMPVSPFIHKNFIYEVFDIDADQTEGFDVVQKCIELNEKFGFDIMHRSAHLNFEADENTEVSSEDGKWRVHTEEISQDDSISEITTIHTPKRILRQIKETRKMNKYMRVSAVREYFIKDKEDFEQFIEYQPPLRQIDTSNITRAFDLMGDKGIVIGHSYGIFNYLNNYRNLEDLLMDPLLDEGFYREMVAYFMERLSASQSQMMDAGTQIINFAMNIASAGTVSSQFFRDFIMEYEAELMQRVKKRGGYTFVHNCGDAKRLLPVYNEMPIDIYESLTHPPFGDTVLEEALAILRKDIVLCGNLDQIDFLVKATPEEVYNETKRVVLQAKDRGRFILGTSDFFTNYTPYENIQAFVAAGREFGRYQ